MDACRFVYGRWAPLAAGTIAFLVVIEVVVIAAIVLALVGCSHRPVVNPEYTYVQQVE